MACVVCKLSDDCGPIQRTDCCGQPFHWNSSCARSLGIRERRGGPTGDLRCAPQCTPCGPPEGEGEPEGDGWQLSVFDELMAEREADDRLRAEDPATFEAKMRAQMPTSKCCLCGEAFKGYGHNAHPVRNEGVACDACNGAIVLPQRFRKWRA